MPSGELDSVSICRIPNGEAVAQEGAHFGTHRKVSVHTSHEALTVAQHAGEMGVLKRHGVDAAKRLPD